MVIGTVREFLIESVMTDVRVGAGRFLPSRRERMSALGHCVRHESEDDQGGGDNGPFGAPDSLSTTR